MCQRLSVVVNRLVRGVIAECKMAKSGHTGQPCCVVLCLAVLCRPTLKRFHQLVVHIDGTVSTTGKGWWTEVLDQKVLLSSSSAVALAAISAAGGQRP